MTQGKLLYGWDDTNKEWVKLQVDTSGYVKVDMSEIDLDDLADVNAPTPADNDALTWDAASGKWIPSDLSLVSRTRVYKNTEQTILRAADIIVMFDAVSYDGLVEFDTIRKSGQADATEANKLHDADGGFAAHDVGHHIWNTTDDTYAIITGFVDSGELTLDTDIMVNGENYILYHSRFIVTVPGCYAITGSVRWKSTEDGKWYICQIFKNGTAVSMTALNASNIGVMATGPTDILYLEADDYIELGLYHNSVTNKDIDNGEKNSYLSIHRLSGAIPD